MPLPRARRPLLAALAALAVAGAGTVVVLAAGAGPDTAALGMAPAPGARCTFADTVIYRPDPDCTRQVIATTDKAKVCRPGYSASVRKVSAATKARVLAAYGLREPEFTGAVDHTTALVLGGSNDPDNLAPIPTTVNRAKSTVEVRVRTAVCDGRLGVEAAQWRFGVGRDWREADDDLATLPRP